MNPGDTAVQDAIDREHLRLLAIGHWLQGGVVAFFSLFPLMYGVMGIAMIFGGLGAARHAGQPSPPELVWMGLLFVILSGGLTLAGMLFAGLTISSGFCLRARKRLGLSQIVAVLNCIFIPYGTLLCVGTLMVLGRGSVQQLYRGPAPR